MKQLIKTLLVSLVLVGQSAYADVLVVKNIQTSTSIDSMLATYKEVILSADAIKALDFTYPAIFYCYTKSTA